MTKEKQSIALAKLLGWNQKQIDAVLKLQELCNQRNRLQHRESFSGRELQSKIEKQEEVVDKLMDDNMSSYELPTRLSIRGIRIILKNNFDREETFINELSKIIEMNPAREINFIKDILDYMETTDSQRTEALLKTLDLWEE